MGPRERYGVVGQGGEKKAPTELLRAKWCGVWGGMLGGWWGALRGYRTRQPCWTSWFSYADPSSSLLKCGPPSHLLIYGDLHLPFISLSWSCFDNLPSWCLTSKPPISFMEILLVPTSPFSAWIHFQPLVLLLPPSQTRSTQLDSGCSNAWLPAYRPTPLMLPNNMVPPNISAPNLSRCHLCFSAAVDKRVLCIL